jgi:hypothetical protein
MYYLVDFKYQDPDKRYWFQLDSDSKTRSRIRKKLIRTNMILAQEKTDLTPYRKSPNYEELKEAVSGLKSQKGDIGELLNTPYNQRRFTAKMNNYFNKEPIPMEEGMENFYRVLNRRIAKDKENRRIEKLLSDKVLKSVENILNTETPINEKVKEVVSKAPTKQGMSLGKKALIGTAGIAGLGAVAYGLNQLRKSRSDKGRKRGKYRGAF